MQQVWISKAGPPEVLQVRRASDPEPPVGSVRIRVEAAGINFADIMARLGLYPDLPHIPIVPGYEVAGRVDAVGAGVDTGWIGRDVLAMTRFGGYADVVCVPERFVFERPQGMSADEGAAFPVVYLTAYQLIEVMGRPREGETVLINGAGGGVGLAAIQLVKRIGATIIGTASAPKHDFLRSIGVDHCIDYRTEDVGRRVNSVVRGRGVDLVLDPIGGASFKRSFELLGPTGRLGMFGISAAATGKRRKWLDYIRMGLSMPWFTFTPPVLMNQNKGVFGVNMARLWSETERLRGWMETLFSFYEAEEVRPIISETFTLSDAVSAHHYIQDRKNIGKVLLTTT